MDIQEILLKVKRANRITDDYSDEVLIELIEQVIEDLIGMGVSREIVTSRMSIGAIARGVWEKDNLHQYTQDFLINEVNRLRNQTINEE